MVTKFMISHNIKILHTTFFLFLSELSVPSWSVSALTTKRTKTKTKKKTRIICDHLECSKHFVKVQYPVKN